MFNPSRLQNECGNCKLATSTYIVAGKTTGNVKLHRDPWLHGVGGRDPKKNEKQAEPAPGENVPNMSGPVSKDAK